MLVLSIAVGGMLGAYARFRLSSWIHARAGFGLPWGTLAVNLAGSFLLGVVLPAHAAERTALGAFAAVGFLGAFTTFSSLAAEALALVEAGKRARAAGYVAASLGLGLAALAAGVWIGGRLG